MSISRRNFLKASALTAAAAAIGVEPLHKSSVLAAAVQESVVWYKSVCRFCGVGCGVMLGVKDGKPFGIKGDKECPVNKGLLCVKGFYLHRMITAKNRLLHPLVRKNGKLEKASWDEAMDLVASRFKEILEKDGPNALAYYGSGQAQTEETYLAQRLFKGYIGTNNADGNPRLCMASAVGDTLILLGLMKQSELKRKSNLAICF